MVIPPFSPTAKQPPSVTTKVMARRFLKLKGGHGKCGQHGMRVPPEKFDLASCGPLPRGQPVVVNTHGDRWYLPPQEKLLEKSMRAELLGSSVA